jgi:hypothetical protein
LEARGCFAAGFLPAPALAAGFFAAGAFAFFVAFEAADFLPAVRVGAFFDAAVFCVASAMTTSGPKQARRGCRRRGQGSAG